MWVGEQELEMEQSKARVWEILKQARNEHPQKCAFFMREWGAWLGLLAWCMRAWCGSNDAQDQVL